MGTRMGSSGMGMDGDGDGNGWYRMGDGRWEVGGAVMNVASWVLGTAVLVRDARREARGPEDNELTYLRRAESLCGRSG